MLRCNDRRDFLAEISELLPICRWRQDQPRLPPLFFEISECHPIRHAACKTEQWRHRCSIALAQLVSPLYEHLGELLE